MSVPFLDQREVVAEVFLRELQCAVVAFVEYSALAERVAVGGYDAVAAAPVHEARIVIAREWLGIVHGNSSLAGGPEKSAGEAVEVIVEQRGLDTADIEAAKDETPRSQSRDCLERNPVQSA